MHTCCCCGCCCLLQGFGADFVELNHQKTGNSLYLHLLWKRVSEDRGRQCLDVCWSSASEWPASHRPLAACGDAPSDKSLPPPPTSSTPHTQQQVPLSEAELAERAAAAAASKPNKLALGTDGGFALEAQKDYTVDKGASLVVVQGGGGRLEVPLPCPDLPELVLNVITAIQVCLCV